MSSANQQLSTSPRQRQRRRLGATDGDSRRSMAITAHLTQVELMWDEGSVERWIRFGHPVEDRILDGQRRILSFAAGSIFAFVRWQGNDIRHGVVADRHFARASAARSA